MSELDPFGFSARIAEPKTFEEQAVKIVRKMLQTAYTFADRIPEDIYMYFQLKDGKAVLDAMFNVNGELLDLQNLNQSSMDHEFDVSEEKVTQLMGFMSQGIQEFTELFTLHDRATPDEVWGQVNLEEGEAKSKLGYALGQKMPPVHEKMHEWRYELENLPESFFKLLTVDSVEY